MTTETFGMGTHPGRQLRGIRRGDADWLSAWERPLTIEAESIQSGDRILALVRWKGRGKGSGAEMEASGAHLWTFREGLVVDYGSTATATGYGPPSKAGDANPTPGRRAG